MKSDSWFILKQEGILIMHDSAMLELEKELLKKEMKEMGRDIAAFLNYEGDFSLDELENRQRTLREKIDTMSSQHAALLARQNDFKERKEALRGLAMEKRRVLVEKLKRTDISEKKKKKLIKKFNKRFC